MLLVNQKRGNGTYVSKMMRLSTLRNYINNTNAPTIPITPTTEDLLVRFYSHHGSETPVYSTYVPYGSTVSAPTESQIDDRPEGWEFDCWSGWTDGMRITRNMDFYGKWEHTFTTKYDSFPGDPARNFGQILTNTDSSIVMNLAGSTEYKITAPKGSHIGIKEVSGQFAHLGGCTHPDDPTSDNIRHNLKLLLKVGQINDSGYVMQDDVIQVVPEHGTDGTPLPLGDDTYIKYGFSVQNINETIVVENAPNPASTNTWSKSKLILVVQKLTSSDGDEYEDCTNYWAVYPITITVTLN